MRPLRSALLALPLITCTALACATSGDSLSGEPATPVEVDKPNVQEDGWAERTLIDLERRLQQAQRVEISFEIQSEGAVASALAGELAWTRDGEIELRASGSFAGQELELGWSGDAERFSTLVAGEQRWTGERPAALVEAVVIGLTRQGLLHNLAVLTGGLPPDHAEGSASEWLGAVEPQLGPPERFGETEAQPLEFGVAVDGQYVGNATLWLHDGLPLERRQTVQFPEGQMKVVERYTKVVVTD
ncbi:hypothetical protein G6O69_15515 [Pseudenhygromyxa sp. WMMC2535]|uniref:hypothetical protein n=1 Tax=Pseudenhygromyxa sp. WMMC2535 TaxID=2712867 RepID=UPI00155617B8|nr:hypothetical protein [Pseudenhygromyxa sp. WMMC2535]NVB39251.1 hypothetical protein [Pseudenhygromyxa sp. WMMC2535]